MVTKLQKVLHCNAGIITFCRLALITLVDIKAAVVRMYLNPDKSRVYIPDLSWAKRLRLSETISCLWEERSLCEFVTFADASVPPFIKEE